MTEKREPLHYPENTYRKVLRKHPVSQKRPVLTYPELQYSESNTLSIHTSELKSSAKIFGAIADVTGQLGATTGTFDNLWGNGKDRWGGNDA